MYSALAYPALWQVIRCARVNPKPAAEIALEVGLACQTVHNLVAAYNRHGPSALETPGRGQRQHAYLSLEQERAVVEHFLKQSEVGQVSTGLRVENHVVCFSLCYLGSRSIGRNLGYLLRIQ